MMNDAAAHKFLRALFGPRADDKPEPADPPAAPAPEDPDTQATRSWVRGMFADDPTD